MTNPEHDPRAEAVAKALSDADGMSWHNEGTYKTFTDAEWAGMEDETDDIPYERPSLGRDFYRDLARAAIAALDIPAIERAAYERGLKFGYGSGLEAGRKAAIANATTRTTTGGKTDADQI